MAVTIQLKRGTALEWVTANPILAQGEMGIELDTWLYKIGDGITAWNTLPYQQLALPLNENVINMNNIATPTPPASDTLNVFVKDISGKMMLRQQGPSGLSTPLQPSFYQNNITIINTGVTTALTALGTAVTSTGTISHPNPTEYYGYLANFATATSANATAGTGDNMAKWVRGLESNGANGFFFYCRLAFSDSNYTAQSSGQCYRVFVGFTDQTLANSVGSNDPSGNRCGFSFISQYAGLLDTNFMFSVKNGSDEYRINTGMTFDAEMVYDFYIFSPLAPNNGTLMWRIDNINQNTTFEGSIVDNLPIGNVFMRSGFQIRKDQTGIVNIRMSRLYVESDR